MEDQKIIELFFARDERALLETQRSYGGYCHAVARAILCNDEDAEEAVSDALLRVWETIPPKKPDDLKLYIARITRNGALDLWRKRTAGKRGGGQMLVALEELGDCVSGGVDTAAKLEMQELGNAISAFLRTQKQRDRGIFLRRYFYLEDTGVIAHRYGMREGNVLQILSRIRRKLKQYLIQEGYDL